MNRKFFVVLLALVVLVPMSAAADSDSTAFVHATVWDATGNDSIADGVVVVENGRIVRVGPYGKIKIPGKATVVDATGKWIIPGLIDPHIHWFQSGGLYTRPDIIDLRHQFSYEDETAGIKDRLGWTFRRYLACGITAVVDVGGPFFNFDVRKQAEVEEFAPRVAVSGPLVSTVARPQMDIGDPPIIKVASPAEARALVRRQLEHKPDLVKIWFILPPSGDVNENLEIIKATIDEAHAGGVRVAVHATQLETARASVMAGADILVHSVDDKPVDREFIELVKENRVIYTTTLVVLEGYAEVLGGDVRMIDIERRYGDPAVVETWEEIVSAGEEITSSDKMKARLKRLRDRAPVMKANLKTMYDAGVIVAAGTDAGNIGTLHGPSLHREFELMAEAGLTPEQVLLTATRNAAKVFSASPEFGTLEPGKLADMVILDADPLADVANLRRIHRVVKGGVIIDPATLLPPRPEEVVQLQVEAYAARDIDAFLSFYAEDAKLYRHPTGELIADGRESMRPRYSKMFEDTPDLGITILQRIARGNMVIDHEFVTGIKGRERIHAVAIYEVKEGLITRVWFLPKDGDE